MSILLLLYFGVILPVYDRKVSKGRPKDNANIFWDEHRMPRICAGDHRTKR